jgi:hypothetical protein
METWVGNISENAYGSVTWGHFPTFHISLSMEFLEPIGKVNFNFLIIFNIFLISILACFVCAIVHSHLADILVQKNIQYSDILYGG